MSTICIYHGNCADGFGAAWAVWKRFPDWEFYPGIYQNDPPDVTGKHVVLVDFSYKESVISTMAEKAKSILILDHHKTALDDLGYVRSRMLDPGENWDGWSIYRDHLVGKNETPLNCFFDLSKSGAVIAWEFFHPGKPVPKLLQHIQDRDLWKFEMEGTRDLQAYIFSCEYDFETWDTLVRHAENNDLRDDMMERGAAIERKHHKDVAELVKVLKRPGTIAGHSCWIASLPYTFVSDAAHLMCSMPAEDGSLPAFAACYWDTEEGRVFGLRSDGDFDVSEVAAEYGGGGHKNAAGFRLPFDRLSANGDPRH